MSSLLTNSCGFRYISCNRRS